MRLRGAQRRVVVWGCAAGMWLGAVFASGWAAEVANPTAVTGGQRVAMAWFNAAGFHQRLLAGLRALETPEGASARAELEKLVGVAMANFAQARTQAEQATCAAQRRLLQGAIEMYHLDNEEALPATGPIDLAKLRAGPYLKGEGSCPRGGTYSLTGPLNKNGEVTCSVHGSAIAPLSPQATATPPMDLGTLIRGILDFEGKNLLRPRGGFWFAVDPQNGFGAFLEADCQPLPLLEFLGAVAPTPLPKPDEQTPGKVSFRLPSPGQGLPAPALTLTGTGIFLDAFRDPGITSPTGPWAELVALAREGTTDFLFEMDGSLLTRELKRKDPPPADPVQKALQSLTRLRVVLGRGPCRAVGAFADPQAIATLKTALEQQLGIIKPLVDKGLYDQLQAMPPEAKAGLEPIRKFLNSLEVVTDGPWLGIGAPGLPENSALIVPAVTRVLAAIAIPNFAKAREKARANHCQANMRMIMGALEMDAMDTGKFPTSLNFDDLLAKKLLREIPVCQEGGTYSAVREPDGEYRITCTVHGPLRR